jgi:hypothetical protein
MIIDNESQVTGAVFEAMRDSPNPRLTQVMNALALHFGRSSPFPTSAPQCDQLTEHICAQLRAAEEAEYLTQYHCEIGIVERSRVRLEGRQTQRQGAHRIGFAPETTAPKRNEHDAGCAFTILTTIAYGNATTTRGRRYGL